MSLLGSGGPEARPERGRACPSAACAPGSSLLGVMSASGRLAYLPVPLVVDPEFAERLRRPGRPESRYRFTGPCAEDGCPQWTGRACDVIDHVLDGPDRPAAVREAEAEADRPLPACGIRRDCRWFSQRGAAACHACPALVADMGGSATYRSLQAAPDCN